MGRLERVYWYIDTISRDTGISREARNVVTIEARCAARRPSLVLLYRSGELKAQSRRRPTTEHCHPTPGPVMPAGAIGIPDESRPENVRATYESVRRYDA
jgi:hypothetical protein